MPDPPPDAGPRPRLIALLRGINVTGRNRLPMADLRELCKELGWEDVRTYIQSGNVLFRAEGQLPALEVELERAIERRFDLGIPVAVRTAGEWSGYVRSNPFPEASAGEPNLVMLALSKRPAQTAAADRLRERAAAGEQIVQTEHALWIHFGGGVARSKISPALLDRLVGSPVTMRNWRTVTKLHEMVSEASS